MQSLHNRSIELQPCVCWEEPGLTRNLDHGVLQGFIDGEVQADIWDDANDAGHPAAP